MLCYAMLHSRLTYPEGLCVSEMQLPRGRGGKPPAVRPTDAAAATATATASTTKAAAAAAAVGEGVERAVTARRFKLCDHITRGIHIGNSVCVCSAYRVYIAYSVYYSVQAPVVWWEEPRQGEHECYTSAILSCAVQCSAVLYAAQHFMYMNICVSITTHRRIIIIYQQ
jgi:hypothetical protein